MPSGSYKQVLILLAFMLPVGGSPRTSDPLSGPQRSLMLTDENDTRYILVKMTQGIMEEALNFPDGEITATKQISLSTKGSLHDAFKAASSYAHKPRETVSHIRSYDVGTHTEKENKLHIRVSRLTFSCLCLDPGCTKAIAADLRGIHNPLFGIHRHSSPLKRFLPSDGRDMPCLAIEAPTVIDDAKIRGCSLVAPENVKLIEDNLELLVVNCFDDTVSSFRLVDSSSGQIVASAMLPVQFGAFNTIPEYMPDPRASLGEIFGGSGLAAAAFNALFETLFGLDFNSTHPVSEAGIDEALQVFLKYASYRSFMSQHTKFEDLSSGQLQNHGTYLAAVAKRPSPLSWTEIMTNAIVLIASGALLGWSVGHLCNPSNRNLETATMVLGGFVAFLGTAAVFGVQWAQMNDILSFHESFVIIETSSFSKLGALFFARLGRDYDLLTLAVSTVDVQDTSTDFTWLFVLILLLTILFLVIGLFIGLRWNLPIRLLGACLTIVVLVTILTAHFKKNNIHNKEADWSAVPIPSTTALGRPPQIDLMATPSTAPSGMDNSAPVVDAGEPAPKSMAETIKESPEHSHLAKAIEIAGEEEWLVEGGPYTLFAPTDTAFEVMFDRFGIDDLTLLPSRIVVDVLSYHTLQGQLVMGEMSSGRITTLLEEDICVNAENGIVTVNGASIGPADLLVENGVVHAIDQVLVPPTLSETPLDCNACSNNCCQGVYCNCDWTCNEQRRRLEGGAVVVEEQRQLATCTETESGCGFLFMYPCTGYNGPSPPPC